MSHFRRFVFLILFVTNSLSNPVEIKRVIRQTKQDNKLSDEEKRWLIGITVIVAILTICCLAACCLIAYFWWIRREQKKEEELVQLPNQYIMLPRRAKSRGFLVGKEKSRRKQAVPLEQLRAYRMSIHSQLRLGKAQPPPPEPIPSPRKRRRRRRNQPTDDTAELIKKKLPTVLGKKNERTLDSKKQGEAEGKQVSALPVPTTSLKEKESEKQKEEQRKEAVKALEDEYLTEEERKEQKEERAKELIKAKEDEMDPEGERQQEETSAPPTTEVKREPTTQVPQQIAGRKQERSRKSRRSRRVQKSPERRLRTGPEPGHGRTSPQAETSSRSRRSTSRKRRRGQTPTPQPDVITKRQTFSVSSQPSPSIQPSEQSLTATSDLEAKHMFDLRNIKNLNPFGKKEK